MEIFVILVAFLDADERPIQNHFDNGGCVQILPRESFLMTDRGIHFTSDRYQSGFIAYKDIKDMMIVQIKLFPNLIINFDNGGCVQILPRERNGGRNIKVIKIVAFSYRDNGPKCCCRNDQNRIPIYR